MAEAERVIPNATHEGADISGRFIVGAVALVVGTLLVIVFGVLLLFRWPHLDRTLGGPLPSYPEPRLQPSPPEDMAAFHASEMARLNGTGWVDRSRGIAHIPIAAAMRQVAREGIPSWPKPP